MDIDNQIPPFRFIKEGITPLWPPAQEGLWPGGQRGVTCLREVPPRGTKAGGRFSE